MRSGVEWQLGRQRGGERASTYLSNRPKSLSHSAAETAITHNHEGPKVPSPERGGSHRFPGETVPPPPSPPFPQPVSSCRGRPRAGKAWEVGEGRGSLTPRAEEMAPEGPRGRGRGLPITTSIRPWKAAPRNESWSRQLPLAHGKLQIYNFLEHN